MHPAGENGRAGNEPHYSTGDHRMDADEDEMPTLTAPETSNKTAAQLAFEKQLRKTEKENTGASATMTYRQRVDEYNRRLASMSEHHDLPKVGPG